jgi:hypothetical protein
VRWHFGFLVLRGLALRFLALCFLVLRFLVLRGLAKWSRMAFAYHRLTIADR